MTCHANKTKDSILFKSDGKNDSYRGHRRHRVFGIFDFYKVFSRAFGENKI